MQYFVYILRDEKGKRYKGMTNNLERRLAEHKRGKTITTSKMSGISIEYFETFNSFEEARKRELYFKTAAGRKFLNKTLSS